MLENLFWLAADKGIQILNAFFVTALVARYLGPGKLGLLAYAGSLLSIATPLVSLGFDAVLIREFITHPDQRSTYFWTAVTTRLYMGISLYLLMVTCLLSGMLAHSSASEFAVILVCFIPIIFSSVDTTRLLFQADIRQKWVVWISNLLTLITAVALVTLVASRASVVAFALVNAGSAILISLSLLILASKQKLLPPFSSFNINVFLKLLQECWPLIFAGLSIALYMNMDIAMLKYLKDTQTAGIYSVAVKLSAFWYFIPLAFAQTFFPSLARAHAGQNRRSYMSLLGNYCAVNTFAAYIIVAVAQLVVPSLILVLFGDAYRESIACFRYHALAIMFVFLGVARGQHLTLERLHRFNMLATLLGVMLNFVLNLILIPGYGASGAAIATVLSYATSAFLSSFLLTKTREIGYIQLQALLWPFPSRKLIPA